MITKPLFRRNFFVFSAFILVAIFIAFASTFIIMSFERKEHERNMANRPVPKPAEMMYRMFEQMDADPFTSVKKLRIALSEDVFFNVDLVNTQGESLIERGEQVLPDKLSAEQLATLKTKPVSLGEREMGPPRLQIFKTKTDGIFFVVKMRANGPPPPGHDGGPGPRGFEGPPPRGEMGPPSSGGPMGGPRGDMRRPPRENSPMMPPPGMGGGPNPLIITVVALVACVLISLGIALFYQFNKYKVRATEAFEVLSDLKHGNLAARMPVKRFDELAPLVSSFNLMADDLERMVENLRKSDRARRQLLQDLAHDLRTPLASLKTFLEVLKNSSAKMTPEKREEVILLCFSEVEYFGRLVEDLLFLAQITEPKYSLGTEEVVLSHKIEEQVNVFKHRYPNLQFVMNVDPGLVSHSVSGDPQLLERLLRNSFENSSSFARSKVVINYVSEGDKLKIEVLDDGPGFSEEALKEFGHKKSRRTLSQDAQTQRISVGIGSVIMKEILELHGGSLSASNVSSENKILGGRVTLTLPKA